MKSLLCTIYYLGVLRHALVVVDSSGKFAGVRIPPLSLGTQAFEAKAEANSFQAP